MFYKGRCIRFVEIYDGECTFLVTPSRFSTVIIAKTHTMSKAIDFIDDIDRQQSLVFPTPARSEVAS
jgi:hypothetical protein